MVEILVIGGLAALGSGIGALLCSGGNNNNNQSSSQSTNNTNQNFSANNNVSGMPLQTSSYHTNTFDYSYQMPYKNNYINNDSSNNTNYSSYEGNYNQSYYMNHDIYDNNPIKNNSYSQVPNRIKKIEIQRPNNLYYGFNQSPIKKLNNFNETYRFGLGNIKKRGHLSPQKYVNNTLYLYNPNYEENEAKKIILRNFFGKRRFWTGK